MPEQRQTRLLTYLFEFLVVVLGVTVSFGLDSWRQARQQATLHLQDVQSLLEDLARDQERIAKVQDHIEHGEAAFLRILEITDKQRRGQMDYGDFVTELKKLKTPYRYSTFFMNNATYKSLLTSGRLQLFPEAINKKLRDYYEYVSKRVDDNNEIVDQTTLRYYNHDHPWVNYVHGAEALNEVSRGHEVTALAADYFAGPGVREHYTKLSFLHGTMSVYDRILIHGMQATLFEQMRAELEAVIVGYAGGNAL
jgi:hypothetical protein